MATTMTYGDYSFVPVPIMQVSVENQKNRDGTFIGQLFSVSLDGTVMTGVNGYGDVDTLQDNLTSALNSDGKRFHITCDGSEILDVYPRINSIIFEPTSDNWTQRSDYIVALEFDGTISNTPPYISESNEEWTLEFADDKPYFTSDLNAVSTQYANNYYALDASPYVLRMTHSLSAIGKPHYSTTGVADTTGTLDKASWQQAQAYILPRLGVDNTFLQSSGVINLDTNAFQYYNHIRNQRVDEVGGAFSVTESWLVINPSGTGIPGNVLEDFTVDTRKSVSSDLTTVTINGSVKGLSTINYGTTTGDFAIDQSKYSSAQSGWNTIQNRLLPRAQLVSQGLSTRALNSGVKNTAIAHNPTQGVISYSYEYDDRPTNCISGALTENISVVDNNPTDVFASLTVLGRASGPILQDIGTVTSATRDVNIDAIMTIPTGCTVAKLLTNKPTAQTNAILYAFELDLSGTYNSVFLQNDSESWNPKNGVYSRSTRWVFTTC